MKNGQQPRFARSEQSSIAFPQAHKVVQYNNENDIIRKRMIALANMQAKTISKHGLHNQYLQKENNFIKQTFQKYGQFQESPNKMEAPPLRMGKILEAAANPMTFDRMVDKTGIRIRSQQPQTQTMITSGIPVSQNGKSIPQFRVQEPYSYQAIREFSENLNKNILQQQRFFQKPVEDNEVKKVFAQHNQSDLYYKTNNERDLTRSQLAKQMYKEQERKFMLHRGVLQAKQQNYNQSVPPKKLDIIDRVVDANKQPMSLKHRISNIKSELNGQQIIQQHKQFLEDSSSDDEPKVPQTTKEASSKKIKMPVSTYEKQITQRNAYADGFVKIDNILGERKKFQWKQSTTDIQTRKDFGDQVFKLQGQESHQTISDNSRIESSSSSESSEETVGIKSVAQLPKPDSGMDSIENKTKRKKKKKDVSKSMANMKVKKKKKKETLSQAEHKVNCAAWGCQCQVKQEKKPKAPKREVQPATASVQTIKPIPIKDHGNRKYVIRPERGQSQMFTTYQNKSKLFQKYPRLFEWDQKQQQKVKMGLLTLEEYHKLREDNIGGLSDSEDERKELQKIDKELSKYSKKNFSRSSQQQVMGSSTYQKQSTKALLIESSQKNFANSQSEKKL